MEDIIWGYLFINKRDKLVRLYVSQRKPRYDAFWKRFGLIFFKFITKLHVAASTSTQISDHRILLQTNDWHEVEAK